MGNSGSPELEDEAAREPNSQQFHKAFGTGPNASAKSNEGGVQKMVEENGYGGRSVGKERRRKGWQEGIETCGTDFVSIGSAGGSS